MTLQRDGLMETGFDILSEDTAQAVRAALVRQHGLTRLTGSYLEFGVFQGYSLLSAYNTLAVLGAVDVKLFGFDSFRGLPPPSPLDNDGYHHEGMFCCTRQAVETRLMAAGVDLRRITLVEGFFDRTLHEGTRVALNIPRATVVLVDCDFYESTKAVLNFIAPLLAEGAMILFDDWNLFDRSPDRGQRLAFREFLTLTGLRADETFSFGWHGQSFAISGT
jgi:O-methyltransferase